MDKITTARIALLHPAIRTEVATIIQEANAVLTGRAQCRIAQGFRTFAEQDALAQKRPRVTHAKGGQSIHNYGLAVDIVLIVDGKQASWDVKTDWDNDRQADWMEVVALFKKHGYVWGGDWRSFKDMPHFEKTGGHSWRQLKAKHDARDFIVGTHFVNITTTP